MTKQDIERWLPRRWSDIAGNQQLKTYFQEMIWGVRQCGVLSGYNALIHGPSRSGKSSAVKFALQSLGCLHLDFDSLEPCGQCRHCRDRNHIHGNAGWESFAASLDDEEATTRICYRYTPIDCSRVTESELDQLIVGLRADDGHLKVILLDEAHRLHRKRMDERLLVAMDDYPAIWIASTAHSAVDADGRDKLDAMFCNRFSFRLETEKPDVAELTVWLAQRCREFGIQVEKPGTTLKRLAERSGQMPGLALHVLNRATKSRQQQLTIQMVDEHRFSI